jgi:hypothetical protein
MPTVAVLNALREAEPDIWLTLMTRLPRAAFSERLVEAACNGTRVLYVERGVWPEEPYLIPWIEAHGCAAAISRAAWERGAFAADLDGLLIRPVGRPATPGGNAQAATAIVELLRG